VKQILNFSGENCEAQKKVLHDNFRREYVKVKVTRSSTDSGDEIILSRVGKAMDGV
jgi:hypothetical protein